MKKTGMLNTGAITMLFFIIAATTLLLYFHSTKANAQDPFNRPFGMPYTIGNVYLYKKVSDTLYIIGVKKESTNYIYLLRVTPTTPPKMTLILNLSIPLQVCCVSVDNKQSPTSIAIANEKNILIYDLQENKKIYFAFQGIPLKVYPNGRKSYILLTNKALYNIRYKNNAWFEERIIIGNLLEGKIEGKKVFDIIPVYQNGFNYSYYTLVEEATAYTVKAQVPVFWSNGTIVSSGQLIATIMNGTLTSPPSKIINGTATVLLTPGSYNATFYLKIGNKCFKGYTYKINAYSNEVLYLEPIFISNKSITICPEFIEKRYLAILTPGYPPRELLLPNSDTQILGNINLVYAFLTDKYLYIWITGKNSREFTRDNFIAILVYDLKNLQPVKPLWRFYSGVKVSTFAASKDYEIVAFSTDNAIYIAMFSNNTYFLTWSLPVSSSVTSLSIIRYKDNYILMATDKDNNIELAFIYRDKPPKVLTIGNANEPWINMKDIQGGYLSKSKSLYMVLYLKNSIIIITNINNILIEDSYINNIYDYIVRFIRIDIYNQDGKKIRGVTVYANLTYKNKTLISIKDHSDNGSIFIPCISYGHTEVIIKPDDNKLYVPIYTQINCSDIIKRNNVLNIVLPYKVYNLSITILDAYSGTFPLVNLEVIITDIQRNKSITLLYPAGKKSIEAVGLLPGNYSIKIIDIDNKLYSSNSTHIIIKSNRNITMKLKRRPKTVIIKLVPRTTLAAKAINVADELNLTVYNNNGTILFSTAITAPTKSPVAISFLTLYRGPAVLKITDIPIGNHGPLYKTVKKTIYIDIRTRATTYTINLEQREYPIVINIVGVNTTFKHVIRIYPINSSTILTTINTTTPSYTLFLPIGYYCLYIDPLETYLGFKLYEEAVICHQVLGLPSEVIDVKLKKIREITPVTIIDPISPNGVIKDNISIILDNKEVTSIPRGKPHTINLPLLINGSNIIIVSENNIYKKLSKNILPSKNIVLKLARTPFKYTLTVLSTRGSTLPGAVVNINGLDNILRLRYTTNEKGSLSITLPYGSYQICVSRPGYILKCYTLTIHASASDVITLKPTLWTILRGYMIPIAITLIGIALIIVTRIYFRRVLERLSEEEF